MSWFIVINFASDLYNQRHSSTIIKIFYNKECELLVFKRTKCLPSSCIIYITNHAMIDRIFLGPPTDPQQIASCCKRLMDSSLFMCTYLLATKSNNWIRTICTVAGGMLVYANDGRWGAGMAKKTKILVPYNLEMMCELGQLPSSWMDSSAEERPSLTD